ncbi:MAG: hypothetical protein ACXWZS_08975 [Gemmatirosa sp.]
MPADLAVLTEALDRLHVEVTVRQDGALAVLVPRDASWFPDAVLRAALLRAARDAGFANVAVELPSAPGGPDETT